MNWSSEWGKETNPLDNLSKDDLLFLWDKKKKAIASAQEEEMVLRKYIVAKAFDKPVEGTNRQELGNGYDLKAVIKYNYKLADNNVVEKTLDEIASVGNEGKFIAERLVSWTPKFLLTEYRQLEQDANESVTKKTILQLVTKMLTISEAAPTLEIVEPKSKKK